jgi:hypothetical protein
MKAVQLVTGMILFAGLLGGCAGRPIQQASIIVPGLQTDLPFDFCLVDVRIQPGPATVDASYDVG